MVQAETIVVVPKIEVVVVAVARALMEMAVMAVIPETPHLAVQVDLLEVEMAEMELGNHILAMWLAQMEILVQHSVEVEVAQPITIDKLVAIHIDQILVVMVREVKSESLISLPSRPLSIL